MSYRNPIQPPANLYDHARRPEPEVRPSGQPVSGQEAPCPEGHFDHPTSGDNTWRSQRRFYNHPLRPGQQPLDRPKVYNPDTPRARADAFYSAVPTRGSPQAQARDAQITHWERVIADDPELGGAHLEETREACNQLMREHASPQLMRELAQSGLGSHPELVRMISRLARGRR